MEVCALNLTQQVIYFSDYDTYLDTGVYPDASLEVDNLFKGLDTRVCMCFQELHQVIIVTSSHMTVFAKI